MTDVSEEWDAAIIGAGAAGMFAAIRAAERGRSVVVLEKNRRPGVKILISGGSRCNLTNARGLRSLHAVSGPIDPAYDARQARGARSIQQAFGAGGAFLGPALKAFSAEATVEFFEHEGLGTQIEPNGKVFPATNKAVDVLATILRRLERSGATLRCSRPVSAVDALENGFCVTSQGESIRARSVIIAAGGQSYPGCGTTGDGYALARAFGHTLVDPRPALVPIKVVPSWVTDLRGIALQDVIARVVDDAGAVLLERREAVLFAHFGLSGPAILDVSRAVARAEHPERLAIVLDLVPDAKADALEAQLQTACRAGRPAVAGLLPSHLPRRLAEAILAESGIPLDRRGPDLTRDERRRLVASLKGLRLPVAGTLGFAKAEVTSGGVALTEVDPETMQSRLQAGLYFCGEVLDLDGLIGGYNFQAAWSTGWLAGSQV